MERPGARRERWLWLVAGTLAALAVCLSALTLWSVWTARSEVPWRDQWTYLDDAREIRGHHWNRLWYSYWGHRPVVARLAALFDVLWFSGLNTPIVVFILAVQAVHAGLLTYVAWRLFERFSRPVFWIVAALIVQLSFSSLQLENFIWAADAGYLLVWTSATTAFLLLALYAGSARGKSALLGACVLSGIVSALSCPNGVFVWPVLILQAGVLRLSARVRAVLLLGGALTLGAYFWRYEPGPPLGMGVVRALLHPWQSIPILGMLVAGTLTAVSVRWAMVVGCVALVFAIYVLVKALRYRPPALLTVYSALALLALLTFAAMVTSRVSPEFVDERVRLQLLVIPSRYYTTVFFFWASVGGVSLWMAIQNGREWPQLAASSAMVIVLTLGTVWWQIGEAANWRGYYRELDVAGSALIMGANDPANAALAQIYPDPGLRTQVSAWLAKERLALFSQRRARLTGEQIAAGELEAGRCRGEAQTIASVSNGVYRIAGWALDTGTLRPPRDLVFVDRSGKVVGVARSGLRRPDLGGVSRDTIGWQGYARVSGEPPVAVYGVLDGAGHYCFVASVK